MECVQPHLQMKIKEHEEKSRASRSVFTNIVVEIYMEYLIEKVCNSIFGFFFRALFAVDLASLVCDEKKNYQNFHQFIIQLFYLFLLVHTASVFVLSSPGTSIVVIKYTATATATATNKSSKYDKIRNDLFGLRRKRTVRAGGSHDDDRPTRNTADSHIFHAAVCSGQ